MIGNLNRNDVASIKRANMTLETFKKKLKKNQEKMAAIDEEFRLKAEKKKQSLIQDSTQIENTITFWSNSTVQLYGKPVEELMEMILTEEEPPLIIHNKETGEEEINPDAVAPAPAAEVFEEAENTSAPSEAEVEDEQYTDGFEQPADVTHSVLDELPEEEMEDEDWEEEEEEEDEELSEFSEEGDPMENEKWPSEFDAFEDQLK